MILGKIDSILVQDECTLCVCILLTKHAHNSGRLNQNGAEQCWCECLYRNYTEQYNLYGRAVV